MRLIAFLLILISFKVYAGELCSKPYFVGDFTDKEKNLLRESVDSLERKIVLRELEHSLENSGFVAARVYEKCSGDTLYFMKERGEGYVYCLPRNKYPLKTDLNVFAKLSGIKPGEQVVLDDLARASKKLERTGYFNQKKSPELYREIGRNRLIPLFYMEESTNSFVEGLLTYSSDEESWIGVLDVSLKNILGTARDLEIQGVSGDASHRISFDYLEPWIFRSDWNGVLRGYLEEDSTYNDALLELGVSRMISFEWQFSLLGGIGNDEWTTSVEISYQDLDSFTLPRRGSWLQGKMFLKKYREVEKESYVALSGSYEGLFPIYRDWICRLGFASGTLLKTTTPFAEEDLFRLGGVDSWKGFRKDFLKTRAYGNTELGIRYQGLWNTAFELFYQPGLYRGTANEGWLQEHQYGLGMIQYRSTFAISLYYAMRPDLSFEEGFLHLGVKALF